MPRHVIAVVEDEPDILLLMDEILQFAGYETILCMRGEDAYHTIRTLQPNLILLDLFLEHQNAGEQLLGLLDIDPATRHIPVIICSANLHTLGHRAEILRAAGHVLLPKPYEPEALLTTITAVLHFMQQARGAVPTEHPAGRRLTP